MADLLDGVKSDANRTFDYLNGALVVDGLLADRCDDPVQRRALRVVGPYPFGPGYREPIIPERGARIGHSALVVRLIDGG